MLFMLTLSTSDVKLEIKLTSLMTLIFKRPFKYQAIIFYDECDDSDEVIVGDWDIDVIGMEM